MATEYSEGELIRVVVEGQPDEVFRVLSAERNADGEGWVLKAAPDIFLTNQANLWYESTIDLRGNPR